MPTSPTPSPPPERGTIQGLTDWRNALLALLEQANQAPASKQLVLCSPAFAGWPLSDTEVLERLTQWLQPSRSLCLIANEFDSLTRQHARFLAWRERRETQVSGRQVQRPFRSDTPSFALSEQQAIWLANPETFAGVRGSDATLLQQVKEQAHEWQEHRSVNALASRALGL